VANEGKPVTRGKIFAGHGRRGETSFFRGDRGGRRILAGSPVFERSGAVSVSSGKHGRAVLEEFLNAFGIFGVFDGYQF